MCNLKSKLNPFLQQELKLQHAQLQQFSLQQLSLQHAAAQQQYFHHQLQQQLHQQQQQQYHQEWLQQQKKLEDLQKVNGSLEARLEMVNTVPYLCVSNATTSIQSHL